MAYSGLTSAFGPRTLPLSGLYPLARGGGGGSPEDSDPDFAGIGSANLGTGRRTGGKATSRSTPLSFLPQGTAIGGARAFDPISSPQRSGGQSDSRYANVSSYLMPSGPMPEYMMPEIDRERISELTELGIGAPMGRLRQGLNRALLEARYSTNPNVRNLALKRALSGYGEGIADIRTGAHREALAEYAPEFAAKGRKATAEYSGRMNAYFRSGRQVSARIPFGDTKALRDFERLGR